jgi:hypothetical protein
MWLFRDNERQAVTIAEARYREAAVKHERSQQEVQYQLRTREELAQDPARWRLATTVTAWSLDGTLYLIDGLVPNPDGATVLVRETQTTRQRQLSKARLNKAAGSQPLSTGPTPGGSRAGSVYVMLNPRDPDAVKIGGTARTAEERAKEISQATGVPVPLVVICEERVDDWRAAEAELHAKLDAHRLPNREFFTIPAKDAVALVRAVAATFIRPGDVIETWDGVPVSNLASQRFRPPFRPSDSTLVSGALAPALASAFIPRCKAPPPAPSGGYHVYARLSNYQLGARTWQIRSRSAQPVSQKTPNRAYRASSSSIRRSP